MSLSIFLNHLLTTLVSLITSKHIVDLEILMDKYASKRNTAHDNSRLKEETPTRKSSRVRHAPVTGGNFCNLAGMVGGQTYREDDRDFDKYFYNDEEEYIISAMYESKQNSKGCRRKRKQKNKQHEDDSSS